MAAEMRVKKNVPRSDGADETNGMEELITSSFVTTLICEDENDTSMRNPSRMNS